MALLLVKIFLTLSRIVIANIVIKEKKNKWLIEVPIGVEIKLGCWPKFPYKRYPIKLPGNK